MQNQEEGRQDVEPSCRSVATIAISVARSGFLIRRSYTSAADPGFVAHSVWRASGAAPSSAAAEVALVDAPVAAGDAARALPSASADGLEFLDAAANLYSTR